MFRIKRKRSKRRRRVKKNISFRIITIILLLICSRGLINNYSDYKSKEAKSVNLLLSNEEVDNTFTVCIDPGHGDWDVGTIGIGGSYEKDIVLDISLELGELLENEGVNVVYARTTDNLTWSDNSTENLYERVRICEESNSDIFISIHCNSAGDSSEYKGIETWYNSKSYNSEVLATMIQEGLSNINYTEDRGIKSYDENEPLAVLNSNTVPAALVELGFISNWSDENYLNSKYGQANVSKSICNDILNYKNII